MQKKTSISAGRISAYQVEDSIRKKFGLGWWTRFFGSHVYISDESYNAVDMYELTAWLAFDDEDKKEYIATDHDCDDFSFQLMGRLHEHDPTLAVGIVWVNALTYGHALNFAIDKDLNFWFVEPQNDQVFTEKPLDWRLALAVI